MKIILEYLSQASTWRGIITFLAAFGVVVKPELSEAIAVAGVGLIGLIEVIRNEKK